MEAAACCAGSYRPSETAEDSAEGDGAPKRGEGGERCFCLFVRLFLPVEGLGRLREGHEVLDWVSKTR